MARGLKIQIKEVDGLYYLCSENKGADQLSLQLAFVFLQMQKADFLITRLYVYEKNVVVRKPVLEVSVKVRFKPACSAEKD